MTDSNKKPELLAPAGNKESFFAVLRAGADAVYLAGNKYGARAYADNFSEEELCSCIRYAHIYNKKVYLTVNTLVTDNELNDLHDFLMPMYQCGLDGVIVQDLGAISYITEHFPNMEVHASTQLNTTGIEGINYLKNMGVCRVVPARELSLKEIKEIKNNSNIELECFIHGAICYCYSGQCLFSSVIGSRSGNRGKCAQPCRLPYSCNGKKEIYPLSLKDMCTIDYLPQLIEAGIDSFKIEGRMKKPEYAAGVTALYRKYIDEYYEKGYVKVTEHDRKILSNLYIRSQVSNGYYEKFNGSDMITLDSPSYCGTNEHIIDNIRSKYVGDDANLKLPKLTIDISGYFLSGEAAYITATYGNIYVVKYGDVVQSAQKRPITAEDIIKQINKLGSTVFSINESEIINNIYVSEDAYYNLKGINELRRAVISELEAKIIEDNNLIYERLEDTNNDIKTDSIIKKISDNKSGLSAKSSNNERIFNISINDLQQLKTVLSLYVKKYCNAKSAFVNRIYIPEELIADGDKDAIDLIKNYVDQYDNLEFYISMPYIRRIHDKPMIDSIIKQIKYDQTVGTEIFSGVLVRNIEDFNLAISLKKEYSNLSLASDYGLYAWNQKSIELLSEKVASIGLPIELCGAALRDLASYNKEYYFEKFAYGRIALMHSANCINKTLGKCIKNEHRPNEDKWSKLVDRTNRVLPVFTDCRHCQNTVFNAVPVTITKEQKNYPMNVIFRLDFTNENSSQIESVLDYYILGREEIDWEYTKAFEKHSTE